MARVILIFFDVCAFIGVVYCLLNLPAEGLGAITQAEYVILFAVAARMVTQIKLILEDIKTGNRPFFRGQVKRLHIMALYLLGLMVAGWAACIVAGILLQEGFPPPALTIGNFDVFPSETVWSAILQGQTWSGDLMVFLDIDLGIIIAAGILWALPYVFKYGAWLEEEQELTI